MHKLESTGYLLRRLENECICFCVIKHLLQDSVLVFRVPVPTQAELYDHFDLYLSFFPNNFLPGTGCTVLLVSG